MLHRRSQITLPLMSININSAMIFFCLIFTFFYEVYILKTILNIRIVHTSSFYWNNMPEFPLDEVTGKLLSYHFFSLQVIRAALHVAWWKIKMNFPKNKSGICMVTILVSIKFNNVIVASSRESFHSHTFHIWTKYTNLGHIEGRPCFQIVSKRKSRVDQGSF